MTRLIMSDGESAVGKITRELNQMGIEVDVSGPGGHVARIERKIQTVKGGTRTIMRSDNLPYTLTMLVLSGNPHPLL